MYIELDQYVKRTQAIFAGGLLVTVASAAAFALGAITAHRDAEQIQAFESRQTMVAEAGCPRRAQLWQHPRTGRLACVLTNKEGDLMMTPVQEPRLAVVQQ